MLTSFTRIVIVLSLLRQALGLQQTPPNIVITGLAMFLSMIVMAPTWMKIRDVALDPYMAGKLPVAEAAAKAEAPLRDFMLRQTRTEDIAMARGLLAKGNLAATDANAQSLPFYALVPAFVSSELTSAFCVGFLIYLPFLVIDLIVAAVLMALGMFMLPPTVITIPLKLLVFVLASGWPLLLGEFRGKFFVGTPSIMNSAIASDLFRSALMTAVEVGTPLLGAMTLVAIIFGVLQAATQVQDASVSFTPKLAAALAVIWLGSTWMTAKPSGGFMHKALVAIPWIVQR